MRGILFQYFYQMAQIPCVEEILPSVVYVQISMSTVVGNILELNLVNGARCDGCSSPITTVKTAVLTVFWSPDKSARRESICPVASVETARQGHTAPPRHSRTCRKTHPWKQGAGGPRSL